MKLVEEEGYAWKSQIDVLEEVIRLFEHGLGSIK